MKYKTVVRIALKLIGVSVLILGFSNAIGQAIMLVDLLQVHNSAPGLSWGYAGGGVTCIVQVVIGLYLIFGGKVVADILVSSNKQYCCECGYELTGNASGVCSECGTIIPNGHKRTISNSVESD